MSEPLVSILIPTFHRPGYLREALASAVGQTYKNLQIIVRDNASGDETPEVVCSFDDPRIEFFQASQNEGPWRNGVECVCRAKGKYLLPLCDDDILGENYVATLVGFMEQDPDIIAAYGATHSIDENGVVTGKRVPCGTHKWGVREIVQAWGGGKLPLISGINFMCLTSFFVGLGERVSFPDGHNTDNAIFMTAGIRGKVLFTDQCVFHYRVHSLNSGRKHSCQLRAQGDREFLRFLDAEVKSPLNVNVPRQEWPKMRDDLQEMLGNWYYGHFLDLHLHSDSIFEILKDVIVYSTQVYGVRNAVTLLSRNRSSLRNEMRRRFWNFRFRGRMNTKC